MTALALLALAFTVIVPPGVMTTSQGGGGALVICTGHGPLVLDRGDQKAPPGKSQAAAACPFAANITPPLPAVVSVTGRAAPTEIPAATLAGDQSPGRGLAAPPPPAIGPPVLI